MIKFIVTISVLTGLAVGLLLCITFPPTTEPECRKIVIGVPITPTQLVPEAVTVCGVDLEFKRAPLPGDNT